MRNINLFASIAVSLAAVVLVTQFGWSFLVSSLFVAVAVAGELDTWAWYRSRKNALLAWFLWIVSQGAVLVLSVLGIWSSTDLPLYPNLRLILSVAVLILFFINLEVKKYFFDFKEVA